MISGLPPVILPPGLVLFIASESLFGVLALTAILLHQPLFGRLLLVLDFNAEAIAPTFGLELRDTAPALLYALAFDLVLLAVYLDVISTLGDLPFLGSHDANITR